MTDHCAGDMLTANGEVEFTTRGKFNGGVMCHIGRLAAGTVAKGGIHGAVIFAGGDGAVSGLGGNGRYAQRQQQSKDQECV